MGCGAGKPSTKNSLQPNNQQRTAESANEREDQINERKLQQSSIDENYRQSNSALSTNTGRSSKNGHEPSQGAQSRGSSPTETYAHDNDDTIVDDDARLKNAQPMVNDPNANNQSNSKPTSPLSTRNKSISPEISNTRAASENAKSNRSERRPSTRPSTRPSSHTPTKSSTSSTPLLPAVDERNTGRKSKSPTLEDGKLSQLSHDHPRCPYCQHCRQMKSGRILSTPKLQWIIENPGLKDFVINMDEYDVDAVTKQVIEEKGRIPGAYDYRPYLTIEEEQNNENNNGNYYKLPFVARKGTHVTPTHTPFPNYDLLQTREQRPNKPYEVQLFSD